MKLQKMIFKNPNYVLGTDEPEYIKLICAVNQIQNGGEFTICGCAIPDSNLRFEDFCAEGNEFVGKFKDVTCPNCRRMIKYIKELK